MIRTLAALTAAVLALGVDHTAHAQGPNSVFSKWQMKRLHSWSAGSEIQLGSIDSGAAAIALTFTHDEDVGAVLTKIGHRGTRPDGTVTRFEYPTTPPAGEPKGLWKAVTRPLSSSTPSDVTPDSALNFNVWVDSQTTPTRAIFSWFGCTIPCPTAKSFFLVEMAVEIPSGQPNRSEWHSRAIRFQLPGGTEPHTLDEVHAPIIYTQQPGDSGLARILVPASTTLSLVSSNLSMRLWRLFGLSADLEHPARGQHMQFSSLYAGDPTAFPAGNELVTAFRKILYYATEDDEGYYKRFMHDCVSDALGVEHYRWCPVYFPSYGPSPWLNFFQSPYPAVICALEAKNDAYWYDVTAHYRDFVSREMNLTKINDPAYGLNPDYPGGSVFVPTSIFQGVNADLPDVFKTFTDAALNFQQAFRGADGQPSPVFMEWQKWLKGDPAIGQDPIGPGYNPRPFSGAAVAFKEPTTEALSEIARARAAGINMSMYTIPLFVDDDDWASFDENWFLRNRDGSFLTAGNTGGRPVDFGNVVKVPAWMKNELYDNVMNTVPDLGGVFLDTLGGQGSFLRYPDENRQLFNHRYHGGNLFVQGGRRAFDVIRDRVGRDKATSQHPDRPFILTEAAQEFYAGKYDFAQHGIKPLPLQMQINNILDLLAGVFVPAPVDSSNPNPPLWNAVYHEYSRADALGTMLSTLGVRSELGGGQPPGFGMTWGQWGDYNRRLYALLFSQGMKPQAFSYFYDYRNLALLVNRNGVVEARDPSVPQQNQLIAFLQRLHEAIDRDAEAGQFLRGGRVERPLALPPLPPGGYNPLVVTTVPNPSTTVVATTFPGLPGVLSFNEDAFTTSGYSVATVFHSVWRSDEASDRLGVVFVNWADFPVAWTGTFDPALYDGFGTDFTVTGLRPNGTGVDTFHVADASGASTFGWGFGGTDVALIHSSTGVPGFMPPRSVQVFVIDPN